MATTYPTSYDEWHHCITVDCGIELTSDYITSRLDALRSPDDQNTARFLELYGVDYHAQVIAWFELAADRHS